MNAMSRKTHTHMRAYACTHTHTHKHIHSHLCPISKNQQITGSPCVAVDQVKDCCDGSLNVTSKNANGSGPPAHPFSMVLCFFQNKVHISSCGFRGPSSLIFSPCHSPVLVPVPSSHLPLSGPALPYLQPHKAAASFCTHHALPRPGKCQVSG